MGVGYTQNRSIEFIPAAAIQQGSNYPIEHMQTNTQIEQTNNQVSPNPSPQQRSIEQIQIQPITHTQNQPIAHTQIQPMAYTHNQPIGYTQNQPVAYTQIHPIAHTQNQPIAHTQIQPIAHTQNQPIGYMQNQPIAHTQNQPIAYTQNQPAIQLAQEHKDNPGTGAAYKRPIGYEENSFLCTLCETPTKFYDRTKLYKHRARFHNAFDQKNRGVKRGDDDLDEISPKRQRGDNKYNLFDYGDHDGYIISYD